MKIIVLTIALSFSSMLLISQPSRLSVSKWNADIDELLYLLEKHHPNPYAHISKSDFYTQAAAIRSQVPKLTDTEIAIKMMQLVSTIKDGHTVLYPNDPNGFNHWFPLSFYKFSDGIYIVSAHKDHKDLIGAKVTKIGKLSATEAFEQTANLYSSDNEFGRDWSTFYLSSGDALYALNIIGQATELDIEATTKAQKKVKQKIKALETPYTLEWSQWGEMFTPGSAFYDDFVMPMGSHNLNTYPRSNPEDNKDLPLHMKSRRAYWYQYIPESKTIYLHLKFLTEAGRGGFDSFEAFYDHVFQFVEENEVEKFILDIRYNTGGDGALVIPFVHKFIRCDKINQKGKLFTLTGRATFSAAMMLYDAMLKHTNTLLVGEPAGAPRNSYGDPGSFFLKNSGLQLQVSTVYWQLTNSLDTSWYQPIDIPAVFSGADYFSGKDPALDLLLQLKGDYKSIPQLFLEKGATVAEQEYSKRKQQYGQYKWWIPFDLSEMRFVARDSLFATGKQAEAFIAWEICLREYPDAWRGWRDYGDALSKVGNKQKAIECYQKVLAIEPSRNEMQEKIDKLQE